jgi:hypothetical protein
MSFTFNGLTLNIEYTIPSSLHLIESEPASGEYQITKLRLAADGKSIIVTHSDTPEA